MKFCGKNMKFANDRFAKATGTAHSPHNTCQITNTMAARKQVLFYFILFCSVAIIGSGVYVYQSGFPNKPLNQALKWMDSNTRGYSSIAGSYLVYVFDSTHNKALQLFDNARLQAYAQAAFLPAKVLAFFEDLRVRTNKQFGAYIPALYKLIGQCRSRTMLTWLFVGAFTGFFAPILGNELRDHSKSGGDRRVGLEKLYIALCWAISGYVAWTVTFNSKYVLSYRPSVMVMSAVNAAMFVVLLLRFKLARYESEEQTEHVKTE